MKKKQAIHWLCAAVFTLEWGVTSSFAEGLSPELALEAAPVSDDQLQIERGMADVDLVTITSLANNADQNAWVQNNQLVSDATGNNAVTNGAFSGASGITTLIQNTGNQVVIQQTTLVNVLFQQ